MNGAALLSVLPLCVCQAVCGCRRWLCAWLCVLAVCVLGGCVLSCVTDSLVIKLLTQGLVIFPCGGPIISVFLIDCAYVLSVISAYM